MRNLRHLYLHLQRALVVLLFSMSFASNPAEAQTFAYVANASSDDVSVIATSSNTVVATVPVGDSPRNVAVTPNGAFAYVANDLSDDVSIIATASNTVVATIPVGDGPFDVAITPDGVFAYVSNLISDDVTVITTTNNAVVATVPLGVGDNPRNVAITPDGDFAYVVKSGSDDVSVIATISNTVVATVPVGSVPLSVAITPDGAFAYVTNLSSGSVSVIATASNSVVTTITGFFSPFGVAVTPDGAFAYVSNFSAIGRSVSVIATSSNSIVATVPVGGAPGGVATTPDGALVYVANAGLDAVSVIASASNTVVATVAVGGFPEGIAITPDPPPVSVTVTPVNSPITIPAGGGSFNYNLTVTNNTTSFQTFDAWVVITQPDGTTVNGGFETRTPTMEPGQVAFPPTFSQQVPAEALAGTYIFTFNLGTAFPVADIDSDAFAFTKSSSAAESNKIVKGWGLFDAKSGKKIEGERFARLFDTSEMTDTILEEGVAVSDFALEQNYPNPFNPQTSIDYQINIASRVSLKVYNLGGQEIRTLVDKIHLKGFYQVAWDGKDAIGRPVASGIYLYKLQAGDQVQIRKMTFLK